METIKLPRIINPKASPNPACPLFSRVAAKSSRPTSPLSLAASPVHESSPSPPLTQTSPHIAEAAELHSSHHHSGPLHPTESRTAPLPPPTRQKSPLAPGAKAVHNLFNPKLNSSMMKRFDSNSFDPSELYNLTAFSPLPPKPHPPPRNIYAAIRPRDSGADPRFLHSDDEMFLSTSTSATDSDSGPSRHGSLEINPAVQELNQQVLSNLSSPETMSTSSSSSIGRSATVQYPVPPEVPLGARKPYLFGRSRAITGPAVLVRNRAMSPDRGMALPPIPRGRHIDETPISSETNTPKASNASPIISSDTPTNNLFYSETPCTNGLPFAESEEDAPARPHTSLALTRGLLSGRAASLGTVALLADGSVAPPKSPKSPLHHRVPLKSVTDLDDCAASSNNTQPTTPSRLRSSDTKSQKSESSESWDDETDLLFGDDEDEEVFNQGPRNGSPKGTEPGTFQIRKRPRVRMLDVLSIFDTLLSEMIQDVAKRSLLDSDIDIAKSARLEHQRQVATPQSTMEEFELNEPLQNNRNAPRVRKIRPGMTYLELHSAPSVDVVQPELDVTGGIDFVNKYCILSADQMAISNDLFDKLDTDGDDLLEFNQMIKAIRLITKGAFSLEEAEYCLHLLGLLATSSEERHSETSREKKSRMNKQFLLPYVDRRIFALVVCLSQRLYEQKLLLKPHLSMSNDCMTKHVKAVKDMFYFHADLNNGCIQFDYLAIELRAAGFNDDRMATTIQMFQKCGLHSLPFFDYLAFSPLFLETHSLIIKQTRDGQALEETM